MVRPEQRQLTAWFDLEPYLGGWDLIEVELGPSQELYVLAASAPAEYTVREKGGIFPKPQTKMPHSFMILRFDGAEVSTFQIQDQHWNYHFIQPLPENELLLVCARTPGTEKNGRVFDLQGNLQREFYLGDGIERVQATKDGHIWTSYFDEGVFGGHCSEGGPLAVGVTGLELWDKLGQRLYSYTPSSGLDHIADCYAMNATSNNEIWIYYYTQFPLVRIQNQDVRGFWLSPIAGAKDFAVYQHHVLFTGSYDHRNHYSLMLLTEDHQMEHQATFQFLNVEEEVINSTHSASRRNLLVLEENLKCYRVDVGELVYSM